MRQFGILLGPSALVLRVFRRPASTTCMFDFVALLVYYWRYIVVGMLYWVWFKLCSSKVWTSFSQLVDRISPVGPVTSLMLAMMWKKSFAVHVMSHACLCPLSSNKLCQYCHFAFLIAPCSLRECSQPPS